MTLPRLRLQLLDWYDRARRKLPWREEGRTPYHVLVSEAMLQQTQVATVIPYFERFMAQLPTLAALAAAEEQTVLRLWQGLGYYSRARNLHKAAKTIIERHGGEVPKTVDELLALPGVGRYTAGAIASIAHNVPAPILDGNVMRVLCRLDAIEVDPRTPTVQKTLWQRAAELVDPVRPGDFNSAMMELGATICTPRNPQCLLCPVRQQCAAQQAGIQDRIPPAKPAKATPLIERNLYRLRDADHRWLVEQRPPTGRWANLWQFLTRPPGESLPLPVRDMREVGLVTHALTHRRYRFTVFDAITDGPAPPGTRWATANELDKLPMSKPQLRARQL